MIEVSINLGASSAEFPNSFESDRSTTGLTGSIGTKYKFTTFVVFSFVSPLRSASDAAFTYFGRKYTWALWIACSPFTTLFNVNPGNPFAAAIVTFWRFVSVPPPLPCWTSLFAELLTFKPPDNPPRSTKSITLT